MSVRVTILTMLALLLAIAGCTERRRGATGESCTSRDDCQTGLVCSGQVCLTDPESDGSDGEAVGGECQARRDCRSGLVCMENLCTDAPADEAQGALSGRGESCAAKNDCRAEFACVMNVCRDVTVDLELTVKNCIRVECESPEDCCANFTANPQCEIYAENCQIDPIFCNTYRSLCECNVTCEQSLCVSGAPGCGSNAECVSQQTPFCVEGECVQCDSDSSCPGTGTRCLDGVCTAACERDEHCPLLHACGDGECADVGCTTDRECVFMTGDIGAVCTDDGCLVPCERDTDCGTEDSFQVCAEGQCVFVGCETDAECRALLGLESRSDSATAVCM